MMELQFNTVFVTHHFRHCRRKSQVQMRPRLICLRERKGAAAVHPDELVPLSSCAGRVKMDHGATAGRMAAFDANLSESFPFKTYERLCFRSPVSAEGDAAIRGKAGAVVF